MEHVFSNVNLTRQVYGADDCGGSGGVYGDGSIWRVGFKDVDVGPTIVHQCLW